MAAARCAAAEDAPSTAELAAMDAVVTSFMVEHSVPGMSVAVARQGQMVYQKGFGFADREKGERTTPAHLFRIASVSKPFTSVAVFRLIEQGRLKLEDLVFGPEGLLRNDFGKPPYPRYVEQIRLVHLLTHTGGGWQNDGRDPMFRNPAMDHRQLIAWAVANEPLSHPPGEQYAYSNFGYCVVGRILEKISEQPYERLVREAVLQPCGISGMRIAGNTRAERANGEVVYYGAGRQDPYDMNVRRMDSHGGWLATAADLVRFAVHVDGFPASRNILRPATIAEMTKAPAVSPHYAKGWAVNAVPNWWHTGSLPGTTSILVRTASGFCWAALANTREAGVNTGDALDRMMWQMVRQVRGWKA